MPKKILIALNLLIFIILSVRAEEEDDGRIVGGVQTDISKVPWQVVVLKGNSLCGGSIIKSNWIVTAAHCVTGSSPTAFKILVGTNSASGGALYYVTKVYINPSYDGKSHRNDIALLKLTRNLSFSSKVKIINMASSLPRDGTSVLISGYGRISSGGAQARHLLSTYVKIVNFNVCNKAYSNKLLRGMFCAAQPGKDTCQGDSGGPVVYNNHLIGVVSWGIGCANPKYPGVYADIPYFKSWVEKTIK